MDNYTLTLGAVKYVSGSGYVIDEEKILTSVPIEAASIAIGEQVTQVIEVTANISSPAFGGNGARSRIDVREDISGTSATGSWIEPIKYEAILTVRNSNGNDLIEYPSYAAAFGSFGMVNENVSKVLELRNSGAAPAEVTLTAPEGFTAEPATITVAAHSSENVTITVDASTPGIKSGNLVIASNGLAEDFALVLSATVLDPNKYFEGFEDNKPSTAIPAGWYDVDNNWSKTSNTNGDNNYVSSSSEGEHKLITPLLKVAEGEKMSFEARKKTASSNTSSYINVYYSADRKNWTLAKEISKDDLDVNTFTTFVLEGVPAGNNYIAFQSGYCAIDNVYGFELVPVAHDVVVKDFKVPTTAMANNDVTATVTLQNLLGEAETEYAPTLYFDGTEVATAEAVEIPAHGTATATVEFTFVANEVGTFPAKAEFVFSEDYTVTTDEVEVTVTPESADALVQVGEATSTGSNVPLYMLYNNSESQTIYTAEQLGLKAGAKITSLTYKGYCTGSKTLSPTVTVWIENTEATAPMVNEGKLFDTEGMTQVFEDVCTVEPKGSYSEHVDMLAFNLNEPFEYTGGNLKVIVRSLYTDYMTVYFEADGNVSGQSIYRCEDVQTTFLEG
ncbi:MAG: choice-of-anchor J domain-containing protein, partial [Muribaculaceae bacterium]|nr:choice-of-anchor J domain-containing protein [Muribaculaceae bacterium]